MVHVRYDTPDDKGETRRDRNIRFDKAELNPEMILPEAGLYLWDWFHDISASVTRIIQGQPIRIPPSEFLAWATVTGRIVLQAEYAILRDMDAAFCSALGAEIVEAQARRKDRAEAEAKSRVPRKKG